jgi:exopolyphosphatase/guanosine-5'-triphosphate,3'-diphosphate pyrophosphatase
MLHDIGTFLKSDKPHNKRGAKIILENKIDGLDNNQNLIVANIVRFHRGSAPKKDKQKIFSELDKESRRIVKIFSSIVRIADALDWGHLSFCENIHLTYDNCREALTMSVNSNIILNVGFNEVFEKKKKLFEKIFEAKLSIKAQ